MSPEKQDEDSGKWLVLMAALAVVTFGVLVRDHFKSVEARRAIEIGARP